MRVASFALAPSRELIARLKDAGVVVIPSVGARRHAEKVAAWGADAVLVQGGEGGGHTGEVATTCCCRRWWTRSASPSSRRAASSTAAAWSAALAYGAAGVAMGTRFLLTSDSTVPDAVKAAYLAAAVRDVTVTTKVDGLPHRMLRSDLVDSLERLGPFPRAAAGRAARCGLPQGVRAVLDGDGPRRPGPRHGKDLTWSQHCWRPTPRCCCGRRWSTGDRPGGDAAGQVAGLIDDLPSCADLVDRVMAEAYVRLGALRPRPLTGGM